MVWMLLINLLTFKTFAVDDCKPFNFITQKKSPFSKIPVRNQSGTNQCYAYTAATLVDYELIKRGATEPSIHPLWAAFLHSNVKGKQTLQIGLVAKTIRYLIEERVCPYDTVEAQLDDLKKKSTLPQEKIITVIEKYYGALDPVRTELQKSISDPIEREKQAQEITQKAVKEYAEERKLNAEGVQSILNILAEDTSKKSTMDVFLSLTRGACALPLRANIDLPLPTDWDIDQFKSKSLFHKKVLSTLASSRGPIGISYCSNVFEEKDYVGPLLVEKKWDAKKDCYPHASVLVGRKKEKNSCQVLIRDSFGSHWWNYKQVSNCLCFHKKTKLYSDCTKEDFEKDTDLGVAACWIAEKDLLNNLFTITTIQ